MKQILIVSVLFVLFGCSSNTEKMTSELKVFMTETFPEASYQVVETNDLYQLMINDSGNVMNRENYEPFATKTFSELYKVFLMSNNSASTDSKFEILYENEDLTWKSNRLTLTDLSDIYRDHSNS